MNEFFEKFTKAFSITGGIGMNVGYVAEEGGFEALRGMMTVGDVLNQCMMALLLAFIGGVGGWIGGYVIKRIFMFMATKQWFRKLLKIRHRKDEGNEVK